MSHLPQIQLHKWQGGQPISAAVLNTDFGALHALIDYAAGLALQPDQSGTEALARVYHAEDRIAALEWRNTATARELGERQYTPLATFGALVLHVNALADPLQKAAAECTQALLERRHVEEGFGNRITLLENVPHPPPAPSVAAFELLRGELTEARAEAAAALGLAERLAGQLAAQRAHADAEEARHSTSFTAVYQAVLDRMDTFEASTAAAQVEEMGAEVARLQRTIDDTDRKAALHKMFTPRAAFAYLLKRVERLERRQ